MTTNAEYLAKADRAVKDLADDGGRLSPMQAVRFLTLLDLHRREVSIRFGNWRFQIGFHPWVSFLFLRQDKVWEEPITKGVVLRVRLRSIVASLPGVQFVIFNHSRPPSWWGRISTRQLLHRLAMAAVQDLDGWVADGMPAT